MADLTSPGNEGTGALHEGEFEKHLDVLREDQLLELIRETVVQLNNLGDKLEAHAVRRLSGNKEDGSSA